MFDVLLPASRTGDRLRQTLLALASSTHLPSSIVLVLDGCALDVNERKWLEELPFEVRVIEQSRQGVTAALKAGESVLRHAFFARVDVGDLVSPARFARQIGLLCSRDDLVAVGVRSRLVFSAPGSTRERLSSAATEPEIVRQLPLRNVFVHGSLMFRREAVQRAGGYDTKFVTSQDYDLLLRLSRIGRLAIVPEVLHAHYFHADGSSLTRPRTQLLMTLKAKWRHVQRGYTPSPQFCLYVARDVLLLLLPARLLARLKSRAWSDRHAQ